MADFQAVMRQFNRMCKANPRCFNCPLHEPDGVTDRCSILAFINDSERIEREVMSWAAEHPAPVYPTWENWLTSLGVQTYNELSNPIPADIAQKLGIEPKEMNA